MQLLEVLEEARSARIVEEVPDVVGHWQFAHVLIQETLAGELSTVRRAELHARVVEVLEDLYQANVDAHADQLAHHAVEAASLIGPQKLVHYSHLAGERALATYAHEEALGHFQRALEAKDPSTTASGGRVESRQAADAETAALLFGLGRAQLATLQRHEYSKALGSLRSAFDYYSQVGDVERAVAVAEDPKLVAPGIALDWADVISRALLLMDPDSHQAGRLLTCSGLALYSERGDYDGALEAYNRALAIAQREEDASLELRTLVAAGHAEAYHLHYQNSLKYDLRAIELINSFPQPNDEWHARMEVAGVLYHTGDLEGAGSTRWLCWPW